MLNGKLFVLQIPEYILFGGGFINLGHAATRPSLEEAAASVRPGGQVWLTDGNDQVLATIVVLYNKAIRALPNWTTLESIIVNGTEA